MFDPREALRRARVAADLSRPGGDRGFRRAALRALTLGPGGAAGGRARAIERLRSELPAEHPEVGRDSLTERYCRLLMALVIRERPTRCIELGTAFGISGAYQAAALEINSNGRLISVDGDEQRLVVARAGWERLGLSRASAVRGLLPGAVEPVISELGGVDWAFIDAAHEPELTIRHFELLADAASPGAVLAFDDVRGYSPGMADCWRAIRGDPRVIAASGSGRLGLCRLA